MHFSVRTLTAPRDQWPECNEAMASLLPIADGLYMTVPLASKLDVFNDCLQVTMGKNGKTPEFSLVEEEPWKCE